MSYTVSSATFATETELFQFLTELPIAPDEQVAIVAGHFMLMYDDQADSLVPMVYQDATNPLVQRLSSLMAGDFPLRTFRLGIRLVNAYMASGVPAKVVLIVNDHIFQSSGWATQNLADVGRAGALRRKFYRQKYPLPKSYFLEIEAAGLTTDVVLENNHSGRTSADILPKVTRLYSEQALRNYFDDHTRRELRASPMFSEIRQGGRKSKLMFVGQGEGAPVCLTEEEGACGCSGELIEFFVRLSAKRLGTLIFFVPTECRVAAEVGVKAFLHMDSRWNSGISHIVTVHGLGGMGVDKDGTIKKDVMVHSRTGGGRARGPQ